MAARLKTFIVLYYAPASAIRKMASTPPEHAAEGMKLWMAWAKKCGNKLVDLGAPLGQGVKVDREGSKPSNKSVAGYSILKAASMAQAKKLLKGHPHLMYAKTCSIEVHEAMPLPG